MWGGRPPASLGQERSEGKTELSCADEEEGESLPEGGSCGGGAPRSAQKVLRRGQPSREQRLNRPRFASIDDGQAQGMLCSVSQRLCACEPSVRGSPGRPSAEQAGVAMESERGVEQAPQLEHHQQGIVSEAEVIGRSAVTGRTAIGSSPAPLSQGDLLSLAVFDDEGVADGPPVGVPVGSRSLSGEGEHIVSKGFVAGLSVEEAMDGQRV